MRIAFVGLRGIPCCYGGFETLVEFLGPELVRRGHEVTVYCRKKFNIESLKTFQGVRLITTPSIHSKYLETITHTCLSLPHILISRYDAIVVVNSINAAFCLPMRLSGARIALNVDGIERKRKKWSVFGRAAYAISEYLSSVIPDVTITDARSIQSYYLDRYGRPSTYLTYGGDLPVPEKDEILEHWGLNRGKYFFYLGRFEPENHPDVPIRAHGQLKGRWPLVMVGDNPYNPSYVKSLKSMASDRVIFTGFVFGEAYRQLLFHAGGVILAYEVGGTHPALVEAMGAGRVILLNDTVENREVAQQGALYFSVSSPDSLCHQMENVEKNPDGYGHLADMGRQRVETVYNWNRVFNGYEDMLLQMIE